MLGVAEDEPIDNDPRCQLFGPTALIVQAMMGVLVIASLVYKRHRESPRRKWKIWMFDVSKQIIGQAMLHGSNVFVSWLIGRRTLANPCVSYFLNILLDTTLGVLLIYSLLHLFTRLLTEKAHLNGFTSGVYGDPPSPIAWLKQASVYFFCLFLMKTVVIILIEVIPWFMRAGQWLLSWTDSRNYLQVIFVMGVFPIVMNILQFWLIDSIVKFKSSFVDTESERGEGEDPSREPLVHDQFDEDDDDEEGTGRRSASRDLRRSPDLERNSIHSRHSHSLSLSKEGDDSASITPTTSSSRTVTAAPPRRRSQPPTPSSSSSSYGSIGATSHLHQERERWGLREEDDDEHAKWGRSLSSSAQLDEDERKSNAGSDGTERRRSGSHAEIKRWESWNMKPVVSPTQSVKGEDGFR